MATLERTAERRNSYPQVRRVSWGAIIGGATIAIATVIVLEILGVAIGATSIDPGTGDSPSPKTLGIGAGIWWLASGVIALFAGSWVAARLAGARRHLEGPLHGLVAWGITAITTMVLMTTMIAMLISGAFRVASTTANVAQEGTKAIAQEVIPQSLDPDIAWDEVWREAQVMLQQTGTKELHPDQIRQGLQAAGDDLRRADLEAALSKLSRSARKMASSADRTAAVNVLVARTGMTREEARAAVERWADTLEDAWATTASRVPRMAMMAADKTANAISIAAWWVFFYLLLTAGAAALGGYFGAPRPHPTNRPHASPSTTSRATPAPKRVHGASSPPPDSPGESS